MRRSSAIMLQALVGSLIWIHIQVAAAGFNVPDSLPVTLSLDKEIYYFDDIGTSIACTVDSKDQTSIAYPTESFKIVPTSELNSDGFDIRGATNYLEQENYDTIGSLFKLFFDWSKLLGIFSDDRDFNSDATNFQQLYVNRNVTQVSIYNSSQVGTFQVILLDDEKIEILGMSKPFQIQNYNVSLKLSTQALYPGQSLDITFDGNSYGYMKVFRVTKSYKDDPLMFNTAPVVKFQDVYKGTNSTTSFITWSQPGMYQVVLFSYYKEIIKGISDVIQVRRLNRNTRTIVTVTNTSYTAGDEIIVTASREVGTPFSSDMFVTFYKATKNLTITDSYIFDTYRYSREFKNVGTKRFGTHPFVWDETSKTTKSVSNVTWLQAGWYKAAVYSGYSGYPNSIQEYRLGVSAAFQVKAAPVRVILPKRTFVQGRSAEISIINTDPSFWKDWYEVWIISSSFTPENWGETIAIPSWWSPIMKLSVDPGIYRLGVFINITNTFYQKQEFIGMIANSTFQVVPNEIIVATDKDTYFEGDTIKITITGAKLLPSGELTVNVYDTSSTGYMYDTTAYKTLDTTQYHVDNNTLTSVGISFLVNWCKACARNDYKINIQFQHETLAISEVFQVKKLEGIEPIIMADKKSYYEGDEVLLTITTNKNIPLSGTLRFEVMDSSFGGPWRLEDLDFDPSLHNGTSLTVPFVSDWCKWCTTDNYFITVKAKVIDHARYSAEWEIWGTSEAIEVKDLLEIEGNHPIVTTDKKRYVEGDTVVVTVTTANKIRVRPFLYFCIVSVSSKDCTIRQIFQDTESTADTINVTIPTDNFCRDYSVCDDTLTDFLVELNIRNTKWESEPFKLQKL
jgi:hypothetical protein